MSSFDEKTTDYCPSLSDFTCLSDVYRETAGEFLRGQQVHAYLFTGPKGIGKKTFARLLGQIMFCTGEQKPCGVCPACVRYRDGNHPDVLEVTPEKANIIVDQIRQVVKVVGEHTFEGGMRAVFFPCADKMNPAAQNCLLKTLEEPTAGTVFFLVTDDATKLLPTIISRCRMVRMHPLTQADTCNALAHYGIDTATGQRLASITQGSVGQALAICGDDSYWETRKIVTDCVFQMKTGADVISVSTRLKDKKEQAGEILEIVEQLLHQMLRCCVMGDFTHFPDELPDYWLLLAKDGDPAPFERMISSVFRTRLLLQNQVNWQAALEQLLLQITEEIKEWQR